MNLPFVGFGTLEKLLGELDRVDPHRTEPVYLVTIEEPIVGDHQMIGAISVLIEVAAVQSDRVLYCRIPLGRVQTHGGKPFGEEEGEKLERIRANAKEAEKIVDRAIVGFGRSHVRGSIAFPRDLKLMNGWADCLEYHRETGRVTEAAR